MSLARRKFLKKGLIGVLSLSLLPSSISFLKTKYGFSTDDLLAHLSFKKRLFSANYLKENFKLPIGEVEEMSRKETVFQSQKTFCLQESNNSNPGIKDTFIGIYEKTSAGYEKVISLNQIEIKAFSRMISYLKDKHKISDPEELQRLLVPTLKSKKHLISEDRVDSTCSSQYGYYTAHGYCSIQIKANGNTYNVKTKLLDFKKAETHLNSLEFQGAV